MEIRINKKHFSKKKIEKKIDSFKLLVKNDFECLLRLNHKNRKIVISNSYDFYKKNIRPSVSGGHLFTRAYTILILGFITILF